MSQYWGAPGPVPFNTTLLKHDPLVHLVHALVDFIDHSERRRQVRLQGHEEHYGRNRPLTTTLHASIQLS